ncbi:KH domain-containing protein YLL032C [Cyberlindnera jadinii]|uniref:KH domain-containing protein YLL032C n=1 Tax=Cyberlindnera jadinii (strain ATCC 18201 / CBS 1600 / BCRC 20928 / JCM 3617 / NBRC 0987 / NRRL Y-1542) TaxID=983966 RepID=A0A0H5C0P4_CYBJN|nr:KH domain-containing protein YLL032C [Cyberlindnera jadinii]
MAETEQSKRIMASIPLKYTYALKSKSISGLLYQSDTGLWRDVDPSNDYIASVLPQQSLSQFQIIDGVSNFNDLLSSGVKLSIMDSRRNGRFSSSQYKRYQTFDVQTIVQDQSNRALFTPYGLNDDFRAQLDAVAKFCNVEILISKQQHSFNLTSVSNRSNPKPSDIYIYIVGSSEDTVFAETRIIILLDNVQKLFVDSCTLGLSMIPVVGGVGFGTFKAIAKETGVNLYLPNLVQQFHSNSPLHKSDDIFFSGLEAEVSLAKKLITENIEVLKYKKDLVLVSKQSELSSIMYKYGVFIETSPLGFDGSTVHFQGHSTESIENAIYDFCSLTNDIYVADISFHIDSSSGESFEPVTPSLETKEVEQLLDRLSVASGVTIYFDLELGSFKIAGSRDNVIRALKMFQTSSLQLYSGAVSASIVLNVELGLSFHEFISGKKNGKISKITNGSHSFINFHPLNEYSMLVELRTDDFNDFFRAYSQLQDELPSEVKFYIPESFHRQIIGTGGSLIQSIMRKYNVFVKFSNTYDLKNNAKSLVRYDNVIIRCPSKNASNIPLVKNELNGLLINNENITFFNTYLKISRNQYHLFNFDKIQEIEKKTSTFIKFPAVEPDDFAIIEVLGTESFSINATRLLSLELAESYEFRLARSPNFHKVVTDSNVSYVEKIKVPLKLLYNFEIMASDSRTAELGSYHSIIISYLPGSDIHLGEVIGHVTAFLREYDFMIVDRTSLSNSDLIISGSAERFSASKPQSNTQPEHGTLNTRFTGAPSGITNLSFTASQPRQLWQLPNKNVNDFAVSQPVIVQPFTQYVSAKRTHGHSLNKH